LIRIPIEKCSLGIFLCIATNLPAAGRDTKARRFILLSVISCRLSVVGYQLLVVGCWLFVIANEVKQSYDIIFFQVLRLIFNTNHLVNLRVFLCVLYGLFFNHISHISQNKKVASLNLRTFKLVEPLRN
jgi:hypothetical protein